MPPYQVVPKISFSRLFGQPPSQKLTVVSLVLKKTVTVINDLKDRALKINILE